MKLQSRRAFLGSAARTAAAVSTTAVGGLALRVPSSPAATEPDPVFLALRRWDEAARMAREASDRLMDATRAKFGELPSLLDDADKAQEIINAMDTDPELRPLNDASRAAGASSRARRRELTSTPATTLQGVVAKLRASATGDMASSALADLERLVPDGASTNAVHGKFRATA